MKKFLRNALLMTMIASALAGCGSGDEGSASSGGSTTSGSSKESGGETKEPVINAYGWEVPEETLEINVYAGQGSPDSMAEGSAALNAYLLEHFNVQVNKIVYDTDATERLNLMLASNDYPEAIMAIGQTTVQQWTELGKVLELTDMVKEYPTLMERFGPYMPRYEDDEGRLWNLATAWGGIDRDNVIPCADTAPMIREDWYQSIGSPDISTPEKYFDVIQQLVEKYPETETGQKVYGLATYRTSPGLSQMLNTHVGGAFGLKVGWDISEEGDFSHWVNSDIGWETVKYINEFARAGLLDPDSLTQTVEEWSQKGTDQRYAAYLGPWWQPGYYISDNWMRQMEAEEEGSYPHEMRYVHYMVQDPEAEQATYNGYSTLGWGRVILTDKCENPEDYLKWFDFENTDLGTKLIGYGVPNQPDSIWDFDYETGVGTFREDKVAQITAEAPTFDFGPYMDLGGECKFQISSGTDMLADGTNCWFNQSNKDPWKIMKDERLESSMYDATAIFSIVIDPYDPLIDVRQRCIDVVSTGWATAIFAETEEECYEIYMDTREKANEAGMKDLEAFYSQEYKSNLEKWAN